jgi:hypothetical protein
MLCSLATKLGDDQLGQITALEEELGVTMLAFVCHPLDPAPIGKVEIARINELEEKLGVSLVAVRQ